MNQNFRNLGGMYFPVYLSLLEINTYRHRVRDCPSTTIQNRRLLIPITRKLTSVIYCGPTAPFASNI